MSTKDIQAAIERARAVREFINIKFILKYYLLNFSLYKILGCR